MNVAIVTIGDEILIGQVVDTNAVWISKELTALGMKVVEMISISDTPVHIKNTLDRLIGNCELIIMTGGLGPTKDDLTKETLAEYFGAELVLNKDILTGIEAFFEKRGRIMIESNRRQALVPSNCIALLNERGTAPGMWFTKKNTQIVSLPGVPYEMKKLMSDQVIPRIREQLNIPLLVHKTVMTHSVPESYLAEMIKEWENNLPECMKLAYLPRPGIVRLRISVTGQCAEKAEEMLSEKIEQLTATVGDHIFGYDDRLLEEVIGGILTKKEMSLATAESCTGGNIARLITSVPGSSAYFKGGMIAYSNEVKRDKLEVSQESLDKYGAVSREVVEEMARGAVKTLGTDLAVATSGIAGPDGGSEEKPVGLVWIAVATEEKVYSKEFRFGGHRELVIEQASIMSLSLLFKLLNEALPA